MHLYDSVIPSGNAYKVQLLLAFLGIEYKTTSLNILATPSETRTPEFLALNPNGRIPVLVLDDGTPLAESNAILFYLADHTRKFLPEDKVARAQVLQWLFFEQYSHEPYIAVWKYLTYWAPNGFSSRSEDEVRKMREKGQAALDVMERHLQGKEWFATGMMTIADIALFAYTQSADMLGFVVSENVRAWLGRVETAQGYVRIKKDPLGKCPL